MEGVRRHWRRGSSWWWYFPTWVASSLLFSCFCCGLLCTFLCVLIDSLGCKSTSETYSHHEGNQFTTLHQASVWKGWTLWAIDGFGLVWFDSVEYSVWSICSTSWCGFFRSSYRIGVHELLGEAHISQHCHVLWCSCNSDASRSNLLSAHCSHWNRNPMTYSWVWNFLYDERILKNCNCYLLNFN